MERRMPFRQPQATPKALSPKVLCWALGDKRRSPLSVPGAAWAHMVYDITDPQNTGLCRLLQHP